MLRTRHASAGFNSIGIFSPVCAAISRRGATSSRIQNDRPCVATTRSSPFTSTSRIDVGGRLYSSDRQCPPSSNETHTAFSAAAYNSADCTGSARTAFTGTSSGKPALIGCHDLPPSWVRNAYGFMSSMRMRFTATYAVSSSNRDASICAILLHGVKPGGVMFDQFAPPSRVIHTRPSSVPAQIVRIFLNDAATA